VLANSLSTKNLHLHVSRHWWLYNMSITRVWEMFLESGQYRSTSLANIPVVAVARSTLNFVNPWLVVCQNGVLGWFEFIFKPISWARSHQTNVISFTHLLYFVGDARIERNRYSFLMLFDFNWWQCWYVATFCVSLVFTDDFVDTYYCRLAS
jgi:hypothetical protein